MLSAMQFKDFIWPHNPRTFHMLWRRRVAVLDAPNGNYVVQDLGKTCRIFTGTGEFYGEDAYATFGRLADTFDRPGPGVLSHPLWYSTGVYFTQLKLSQEPRKNYVVYSFEFTETRQTLPEPVVGSRVLSLHTVRPGETLWSIAVQYGVSVEALLEANPEISAPNALEAGQVVKLP